MTNKNYTKSSGFSETLQISGKLQIISAHMRLYGSLQLSGSRFRDYYKNLNGNKIKSKQIWEKFIKKNNAS